MMIQLLKVLHKKASSIFKIRLKAKIKTKIYFLEIKKAKAKKIYKMSKQLLVKARNPNKIFLKFKQFKNKTIY